MRGREDVAPAQVGRAAGTPSAEKTLVGTTLAGAAGRQLAGMRLRQAILAGEMSHGQRLIEADLAEMVGVNGEPMKYSALNHELHRLVREISGQSAASGLIERLNEQLVRHQFRLSLPPAARRARWVNTQRSSPLSPDDSPTRPSKPCAAIFAAS